MLFNEMDAMLEFSLLLPAWFILRGAVTLSIASCQDRRVQSEAAPTLPHMTFHCRPLVFPDLLILPL